MEVYSLKKLSFTYPDREEEALKNISLSITEGEFTLICGKSGCGKTTLLRLLKSSLSPFGNLAGEINYYNQPLSEVETRKQTGEIGFVLQNPDNQIVTDKVWHELAFGLESLGMKTHEIRTKVSEMASFFGIQNWFYMKTDELSGGQKQILNLASVMVMQPEVLILDEPTSQLDPIAASDFLKMLKKINDELGTTIILSEHRLEEAFSIADRVIVMDSGEIIADGRPKNIGKKLYELNHDMYNALPVPMRVFGQLKDCDDYPVSIREGKMMLMEYCKTHRVDKGLIPKDKVFKCNISAIEVKDVYFRYEKDLPDVIKGLNLIVNKGEFFSILGGNGTGKSTAISLISGLNIPQRGEIKINGYEISKIYNLYEGLLGVLPQNPQNLFAKKTVFLDLLDITDVCLSENQREKQVKEIAAICRIENLLNFHPYDLSGGEQQKVALAMILLRRPQILILDEPTKGMDACYKKIFADILNDLMRSGVTILMVSHDIEFCAEYSDRCAMFFDGSITSVGTPRQLFSGNSFYTTGANRMARKVIPEAILADEIVLALGGEVKSEPKGKTANYSYPFTENTRDENVGNGKTVKEKLSDGEMVNEKPITKKKKSKLTVKRIISGILCLICFTVSCVLQSSLVKNMGNDTIFQGASIFFAGLAIACFFPQKKIEISQKLSLNSDRKLTKITIAAVIMILVAIPITIYFGIYYLDDRKYYFISLLIILETMLPFCMIFEKRKPEARELVIISVLCAIAVAGRTAFFMLPEFKPVVALVIISGICFGGETGFLVGSVTGFVSNFVFGQGPWTPWQMFAFGIIGFIAGLLFKKGFLLKTKMSLSVFGFLSTIVIYGGIMNTASVLMMTASPTLKMLISACVVGIPFDFIHGISTVFFLWFIAEPMIEKLERIKVKYGLVER